MSTALRLRVLVVVALAAAACGGKQVKKHALPPEEPRVITAGQELYALLPPGADAVVELDLARLRRNEVVGPLMARLGTAAVASTHALGFDPARDVDLLVAAAYDVGDPASAGTVVLVRGEALVAPAPGAKTAAEVAGVAVDAHTLVFAPPELRGRVLALAQGEGGGSLADDRALALLRDAAMPVRAPGATMRLAARLAPAQQVDVAGQLGVDMIPATVSAWVDFADDAALIADLGAGDAKLAEQLAHSVDQNRDRLRLGLPEWLHLRDLLELMRVDTRGDTVRVVWVIGPKALAAWVDAMGAELIDSGPVPPPSPSPSPARRTL